MDFKIRNTLKELERKGYASESLTIPKNGVDCSEGCNPFGYPDVIENINERFAIGRLASYPHDISVYEAICSYWSELGSLSKDNIILTDGSIQAIFIVNSTFNAQNAKVVGISPQFAGYVSNAKLLGMQYESINLKKTNNFKINIDDIITAISKDVSLVYLNNPNNPTGQVLSIDDLKQILSKARGCNACVVVDEAYGDFMEKKQSAIGLVDEFENLIVLRTLSKGFGLAGARVGYMIASTRLVSIMNKLSNPYSLSEYGREILKEVLTSTNKLELHKECFKKQKNILRENIGTNLYMAETEDTVPICLLYHRNDQIDLRKKFLDHLVLTVPGCSFEGLDKSFVRIRLPKMEDFTLLLKTIQNIDQNDY